MGERAWVHNLFAFLPLLPECGEDNWNHYITSSVDRITGIIHSKLWHWPAKEETLQLIVKTKKGRRQRKEKSKQVVENSEYSSCCRSLVNSRPGAYLLEVSLGFIRSLAPHWALSSTLESEAGRLTIFFWAFVISFVLL